jgi:PAS domain S-box-containing protein
MSRGLTEVADSAEARLLEAIATSQHDRAIIVLDRAGRIVRWNCGAAALFGWDAAAAAGRSDALIFTPEDAAAGIPAILRRAARHGEIVEERIFGCKDGTRFVGSATLAAVTAAGGTVEAYVLTVRDRTAEQVATAGHAAAEERRRATEARLRLAIDAGRMAVWEYDVATDSVAPSPELNRLLGFPPDAAPSVAELRARYHRGDGRKLRTAGLAALARGERFFEAEHRVHRLDGALRWLLLRGEIVLGDDGAPRAVRGVVLDITDHKEADEERERLVRALAAEQSHLQTILKTMQSAIVVVGAGGRIVLRNAAASRLVGLGPDAPPAISGPDPLDTPLRADGTPYARDSVPGQRALVHGETVEPEEMILHRRDGETVRLLVGAAPIRDADGRITMAVCTLQDMTAQRRAEEDLRAALGAAALVIFDFDHLRGEMRPSPEMNALFGYPPDQALTLEAIRARYHPEDADQIEALARAQLGSDENHLRWEFRLLLPDGQLRWVQGLGEYIRDGHGRVVRSHGVALDITERKRAEEHLQLLVHELNHRVKNTLATVLSIADQMFRNARSLSAARAGLTSRLLALAKAHDVLTQENWEGADLADIVSAVVEAHQVEPGGRFRLSGPRIWLPPRTALSLSMALHELATNAIKYGALSNEDGVVEVNWAASGTAQRHLHLSWRERGGPPVVRPTRRGFGSRLIERGLAAELNAKVEIDYAPGGVVCTLDAALPDR